jgi:hypothetical protein
MIIRRLCLTSFALVLLLVLPIPCARGMAFIAGPPPTLRKEAASSDARAILIVTIRTAPDGKSSELDLNAVLRSVPCLKGKKWIPLGRLVEASDKQFIVFCDLDNGKIEPYRGVQITRAASITYLRRVLALPANDARKRLGFFFRHLDDPDPEVSGDAFREFANASEQDILRAGRRYSAEKVRKWLKNPKTPAERLGVYGLLLGACGKARDARLLRKLLDRKEDRYAKAAKGILAGLMQLNPRAAWTFIFAVLRDQRKSLDLRLTVLCGLGEYRGDRLRQNRVHLRKAAKLVLADEDLADIAVEYLRRWQMWDLTRQVLSLDGKKEFDLPIIRRAILFYALSCKPTAESKAYLAKQRAADPDRVKDAEELLELERA